LIFFFLFFFLNSCHYPLLSTQLSVKLYDNSYLQMVDVKTTTKRMQTFVAFYAAHQTVRVQTSSAIEEDP